MEAILDRFCKLLLIAIFAILIIPSASYVMQEHNEKLTIAINKKIIEIAQKCKYEKKCQNNEVTLEELHNLGYIDKIYDPISKELINEKSYVNFDNNEFKIVK